MRHDFQPLRLLILGGTVFVGRHVVEEALRRGYDVTLFNRGQSNVDLFPNVETLIGNRDGDLTALEGRRWDAVIDTCGYVPRVVNDSATLLSNVVNHYTFVSSISVYADLSKPGITELSPVGTLEDPEIEEVTGETYGPLKSICEKAAEKAMEAGLNFRPVADTARDTMSWLRSRPADHEWRAGITIGREGELLEQWRDRS